MNKNDYKWLERHTDIRNFGNTLDDCLFDDVLLKVHRPHHQNRINEIFRSYKTEIINKQDDNSLIMRIRGFSVNDLYGAAVDNGGDTIYNEYDGRIYFIPTDKNKLHKTFRRANPSLLANLSTNKKLDILYSFRQQIFPNEELKDKNDDFIARNSPKFLALLQLKIPTDFIDYELRKVRLIARETAKLPNIKNKLNNFTDLAEEERENIFTGVCNITADINKINHPHIQFVSSDKVDSPEWLDVLAYTSENSIIVDKDKMQQNDALGTLGTAFHETNHIAQAHGDYSQFPLVEDMLSINLDYPLQNGDLYIFTPQELITYKLESEFDEQIITQTGLKNFLNENFACSESQTARQYVARALKRSY
jgi:hypothetical protein